jgi:RNA polymerase sigma factor (sigma-70 family)
MNKGLTYTDQDLVAELKTEGRRKQAVVFLYRETAQSVLRLVLKYGGTEADRDELMNEAFLVLIDCVEREKFRFQSRLSTFYMGICRRIWFNWRKKASKVAGQVRPLEEMQGMEPMSESAEVALEKSEKLHILNLCLDKLGERGKQLLLLSREVPALSWPEIAQQLAYSSHQTAKNAAQRFMKRVADCVKSQGVNE